MRKLLFGKLSSIDYYRLFKEEGRLDEKEFINFGIASVESK
ncbi:MAG: hypothetical protein N2746_02405 [Deltaproteobacteria bacterium]|nr:hypothetical protein [Deltaproteobacteria bacterium]